MGISAPRKRNETHRAQIEGYLAGSRRTAAPSTFESCFDHPGIEPVNASTNPRSSLFGL